MLVLLSSVTEACFVFTTLFVSFDYSARPFFPRLQIEYNKIHV